MGTCWCNPSAVTEFRAEVLAPVLDDRLEMVPRNADDVHVLLSELARCGLFAFRGLRMCALRVHLQWLSPFLLAQSPWSTEKQ